MFRIRRPAALIGLACLLAAGFWLAARPSAEALPDAGAAVLPVVVHRVEHQSGDEVAQVFAGRDVPAVVRNRVDTVEPDTRTVLLVLELLESPPEVRLRALARLRATRRVEAEGFWLPLTAFAESRRGLWSVYAVVPAGAPPADATGPERAALPRPGGEGFRVERRQVDLLHAEAERVFVRGTLREGERVVATGIHRLVPGQPVSPREPDPALRDGA